METTRAKLLLAIGQADGQPWPDGMDMVTAETMYGKIADAAVAVLVPTMVNPAADPDHTPFR